jgi:hypothetical protein
VTPPLTPEEWRRLSALLDEALERTPAERVAWLAELALHEPDAADR